MKLGRRHRLEMRPAPATRATAHDQGSASVWAIAVLSLMLAIAIAGLGIGAATVARHRAASAADLAALAAASALARGGPDPCAVAERIARAQGGEIAACGLDGLVADVVVRVPVAGPLSFGAAALMRARAGPSGA